MFGMEDEEIFLEGPLAEENILGMGQRLYFLGFWDWGKGL